MDVRMRERIRSKFSRRVYFAFVLFLAIALSQWGMISIIPSARSLTENFEIWCSITFCLAGILFCLFAFIRIMRSHNIVKWVMAAAIVELYVVSMFILAIASWLPDLLVYFIICFAAIVVALIVGCNLSISMDMTENLAQIFIACFIMAAVSMYALMLLLLVIKEMPYAFAAFEFLLSLVMLLLVMLHAQTIRGDRFIQMSTDDFLLAALLLFHEFLAMYAMTFFWQLKYAFFTPNDFFWTSTRSPSNAIGHTHKQDKREPPNGFGMVSDYRLDINYD